MLLIIKMLDFPMHAMEMLKRNTLKQTHTKIILKAS